MRNTRTAVLVATVLAMSACGSSVDEANTTNRGVDTPVAAGVCRQDEPDCDDTGFVDAPPPLSSDGSVANADDGIVVVGTTVDGGLDVEAALDNAVTGVVAVEGYLFDDGTGLRLCDFLAESFPPQCGGSSLTVEGFAFDRMIELPEYELVQVETSGGVTWTDGHVTLFGEVVDGNLVAEGLDAG